MCSRSVSLVRLRILKVMLGVVVLGWSVGVMFSECGGIIMFACGVGVFTYPVV